MLLRGKEGERGNVCEAGGCGSLIWKLRRLLFRLESVALTGSCEDGSSSSEGMPHDLLTGAA